jgi:hypothetical protein
VLTHYFFPLGTALALSFDCAVSTNSCLPWNSGLFFSEAIYPFVWLLATHPLRWVMSDDALSITARACMIIEPLRPYNCAQYWHLPLTLSGEWCLLSFHIFPCMHEYYRGLSNLTLATHPLWWVMVCFFSHTAHARMTLKIAHALSDCFHAATHPLTGEWWLSFLSHCACTDDF